VPALRSFTPWLDGPVARQALGFAPLARARAAAALPVPERHLVLFRAGGLRAALPAETVRAVLAPARPHWLPGGAGRGCLHRGEMLPLRDAGLALGGPPAAAEDGAPMIRLALHPECLLAVTAIEGVRRIPAGGLTPLGAGDGLVTALALVQGDSLPLLSPAALAA